MFVTSKAIRPTVYSKPVCGAPARKKRAALGDGPTVKVLHGTDAGNTIRLPFCYN